MKHISFPHPNLPPRGEGTKQPSPSGRGLGEGIIQLILLIILCIYASPTLATSIAPPVTNDYSVATLQADRESISAGEPFWIALHLEMKKGWHTYWKNPGDSGIPTTLKLDLPEGFSASDIHWPTPIRFEMAGIVNYGYKEQASHFIQITPPESLGDNLSFTAKASWLICEDICVPEYADFDVELPVTTIPASINAAFHEKRTLVPSADILTTRFNREGNKTFIQLPSEGQFFPLDNDIVSNSSIPTVHIKDDAVMLAYNNGGQFQDTLKGVWQDASGKARTVLATHDTSLTLPITSAPDTKTLSFGAALLFAFLGGLILNLMPCVLPVLSLKALSLVKLSEDSRSAAIKHGLAYTLGILLCFTAIAVLLMIIQQSGAQIGWGFQLQSPAFVAGLALLMFLVGLNLSGMYELPTLFGNVAQSASSENSPKGSFFTGMLAVLVATPCTAPLMAPAIGYALSQPPAFLVIIFLALGLGLAAPFLLISLIPAISRLLPKPGAWMLRFKQFLAFPMYATAAWLIWVLTRQAGADALAYLLAAAIAITFLLWRIPLSERRADRYFLLTLIVVVFSASLSVIHNAQYASSLAERTEPYSADRLAALRADNQPVFINATADWCITCKINEKVALNTSSVAKHFEQSNIIVLKADWTAHDAHITEFLRSHKRAGVPLYVFYGTGKEGVLLPQLLTAGTVIEYTQN